MNVKNKGCIRRLSLRQLKAGKMRNLIAIAAIALTTLLFTSLFTVAMSLNASYEEYTFRQVGGSNHGTFKEVDQAKIDALSGHRKVKAYGLRTVCGFSSQVPFAKTPAEISWMDKNTTKWSYAAPTTGRMPESGMEIAMDTEALRKLGVPAELGQQVSLTYEVQGKEDTLGEKLTRTDVFTLVGFWEYDPIMPVHYLNISRDYLQQVQDQVLQAGGEMFRTDMNIMLASSVNIRGTMESIERDLGYQWEDTNADNCVRIGVNWGYTSAELGSNMDPTTVLAMGAFLVLVVLTGYLIIYNIFQISVSNDIRFYGLLKTIGTTPRQLRRMVRQQAMYLSLVGIPMGCVLGYGAGVVLLPRVMSVSSLTTVTVSASPLIFAGAALFSLATVFLSCAKPSRKAARITPVEAVRYTEAAGGKKQQRATRGAGVRQMALANLGRNRTKTALVIVSLSLAVVLLNAVFLFTNGFDMEKYLAYFSSTDFVLGTPAYFRSDGDTLEAELTDEALAPVLSGTDAQTGGSVYTGAGAYPQAWLTDRELAAIIGPGAEKIMEQYRQMAAKRGDLTSTQMLIEGMDEGLFSKLTVYEGSLEPLTDPSQNAIALVASLDDYGEIYNYPLQKVGDTLTVTYVDEGRYYDSRTGELCSNETPEEFLEYRVEKSHDVTYTVCALVGVPDSLSHRFGLMTGFSAVLSSEVLQRDYGANVQRMLYAFDTPDGASEAAAEQFLADYTAGEASGLMYESKALLRADFDNFRNMFVLVGAALCFIVGLVGILNFFNAILTSILTRRREFAMLQSVGMTGRQLKAMLVWEGLFYAGAAGLATLALSLALNPLVGRLLGSMFWFFSYRFTILPVLVVIPVFLALGAALPLTIYRFTAKKSIVERLREAE
ncbi:MAG: ABC transporter permease [Eubacteriales bacterium]|nr:ABC transporter permease [Eubacteriales bacterium]